MANKTLFANHQFFNHTTTTSLTHLCMHSRFSWISTLSRVWENQKSSRRVRSAHRSVAKHTKHWILIRSQWSPTTPNNFTFRDPFRIFVIPSTRPLRISRAENFCFQTFWWDFVFTVGARCSDSNMGRTRTLNFAKSSRTSWSFRETTDFQILQSSFNFQNKKWLRNVNKIHNTSKTPSNNFQLTFHNNSKVFIHSQLLWKIFVWICFEPWIESTQNCSKSSQKLGMNWSWEIVDVRNYRKPQRTHVARIHNLTELCRVLGSWELLRIICSENICTSRRVVCYVWSFMHANVMHSRVESRISVIKTLSTQIYVEFSSSEYKWQDESDMMIRSKVKFRLYNFLTFFWCFWWIYE